MALNLQNGKIVQTRDVIDLSYVPPTNKELDMILSQLMEHTATTRELTFPKLGAYILEEFDNDEWIKERPYVVTAWKGESLMKYQISQEAFSILRSAGRQSIRDEYNMVPEYKHFDMDNLLHVYIFAVSRYCGFYADQVSKAIFRALSRVTTKVVPSCMKVLHYRLYNIQLSHLREYPTKINIGQDGFRYFDGLNSVNPCDWIQMFLLGRSDGLGISNPYADLVQKHVGQVNKDQI